MSRPPNILLFITDQHRADHLGCYGNSIVQTPNIDRIAAQGRSYDRFYVASPVCMVNRATLMTGRMPSVHGVRHNGIPLSTSATTFVDLLRSAGYATALVGKSHLQNMGYDASMRRRWANANGGRPPTEDQQDAWGAAPIGRSYDNEWTPLWEADPAHHVQTPYYGFDHVELCTFHGDQVGGDYSRWLAARHANPDQLRGRENAIPDARYGAPQAWQTRMPANLYPSSFIAERSCAWLAEHARYNRDTPFFLKCSFPDPHHPYTPPGKYWDMYAPEQIDLPSSFHVRDSLSLVRAVEADTRSGRSNREGYVPFTVNERECREIIALTYGMITLIDDCVGQVMNSLRQLGLDDDTVVLFTSDHGDWMGDHGLMLKGPMHYQGLIRVPFIWRDTKDRTIVGRSKAMAGTLDIAATVLDRAGLAPYNGIQGQALLRQDEARAEHRPMVIESEQVMYKFGQNDRFRIRSLLHEDCRLSISDHEDLGELYDLRADPHELHNLWDSVEHAALKARLIQRLAREMIRLADDSPLPTALA